MEDRTINVFVILRILIGIVFIVSGFEKLTSPYQNFLYVIQSYEFVPKALEVLVAKAFPWFELIVGLFVVLGLWVRWSLAGAALMVVSFLTIVSQAIIRKLPIDECGCFGELVSFPLHVVLMIDLTLFCCIILLAVKYRQVSKCSLDHYFNE